MHVSSSLLLSETGVSGRLNSSRMLWLFPPGRWFSWKPGSFTSFASFSIAAPAVEFYPLVQFLHFDSLILARAEDFILFDKHESSPRSHCARLLPLHSLLPQMRTEHRLRPQTRASQASSGRLLMSHQCLCFFPLLTLFFLNSIFMKKRLPASL